jgi:hypothetical protein
MNNTKERKHSTNDNLVGLYVASSTNTSPKARTRSRCEDVIQNRRLWNHKCSKLNKPQSMNRTKQSKITTTTKKTKQNKQNKLQTSLVWIQAHFHIRVLLSHVCQHLRHLFNVAHLLRRGELQLLKKILLQLQENVKNKLTGDQ